MRELMVEFRSVSAVLSNPGHDVFKISVLARQKKALIAWMDEVKALVPHFAPPRPSELTVNKRKYP
jgi:hypothetical protein